jgi:hypothetical protein
MGRRTNRRAALPGGEEIVYTVSARHGQRLLLNLDGVVLDEYGLQSPLGWSPEGHPQQGHGRGPRAIRCAAHPAEVHARLHQAPERGHARAAARDPRVALLHGQAPRDRSTSRRRARTSTCSRMTSYAKFCGCSGRRRGSPMTMPSTRAAFGITLARSPASAFMKS